MSVTPRVRRIASDSRASSFALACLYGALRNFFSLKHRVDLHLTRPIRKKDKIIETIMVSGLYQAYYMRVPVHAAVSESVNCIRQVGMPWASGLVNATLRKVLENSKPPNAENDEILYEHPEWLINLVKKSWANQWKKIMLANNSHPPMTLRINSKFTSRTKYLGMLKKQNVRGFKTKHSQIGITLSKGIKVERLPLFSAGSCSVQDEAAQLVAPLLALEKDQRILDACAAPGGKAGHIGEIIDNTSELVALEINKERISALRDNIERLKIQCKTFLGDAANTEDWFDGRKFDRILADVPCSGTGVIRRHPDIRFHRTVEDIGKYSQLQLSILKNLWPLLKPNGFLLYVTCSILREENDNVLGKFISRQNDACVGKIDLPLGYETHYGHQILPGENMMDGFFFSRIEKRKND